MILLFYNINKAHLKISDEFCEFKTETRVLVLDLYTKFWSWSRSRSWSCTVSIGLGLSPAFVI